MTEIQMNQAKETVSSAAAFWSLEHLRFGFVSARPGATQLDDGVMLVAILNSESES
jgi:hypothetical protein